MKTKCFLTENVAIDLLMLYSTLKRLTTPFEKTKAFELGIIDKDGKVLKKGKDLKTPEEKNAYTLFDRLVFNLKRILEKLPFGKTRIASFAAALFLLKEQNNKDYDRDPDLLVESVTDWFEMVQERRKEFEEWIKSFTEDAAANAVGTGAIAGTGHDGDDPAVSKSAQEKYKKKTFDDFLKLTRRPKPNK
jgi:hypothetical protein